MVKLMAIVGIVGIFLLAFSGLAIADSESAELTELESTTISSTELESILNESLGEYKRVGFSKIFHGNGWIENGNQGHFIAMSWSAESLALYNKETKTISDMEYIRSRGILRISDLGVYRLVRINESSNDSVSFYVVYPKNANLQENEASKVSLGKLNLRKTTEHGNFAIWAGSLSLESGDSWSVDVATKLHTVRNPGQGRILVDKANLTDSEKSELKSGNRNNQDKKFWRNIFRWNRK